MTRLKNLCDSSFGFLRLWRANRELRDRLKNENIDNHVAFEDIRKLDSRNLKSLISEEKERQKTIDEKLQKLTATLSIVVAVGGLVVNFIFEEMPNTVMDYIISVFFLFSMLLILGCAIISFQGLRPKPKAGIGATYLRIIAAGGDEADLEMKRAASHFQIFNAIQANYTSAATDLIRNGIILFAVGVVLSALDNLDIFALPFGGAETDVVENAVSGG